MNNSFQNIILFGAPGAGKGTQAKRLLAENGYVQLSTGDLVRAEIATGSTVGQEIEKAVAAGKFPSDEVILGLVRKFYETLDPKCNGVIFDGFPRTENQARFLESMLADMGSRVHHVIILEVDVEVVKKRILGRFSCDSCGAIYNDFYHIPKNKKICDDCSGTSFTRRTDDTAEAIDKRLETFLEVTRPVLGFYEGKAKIDVVDGAEPPEKVFEVIRKILLS